METNQQTTVCIREYRIIKKRFQKTVGIYYKEKRQRGEIIAPNLHQCYKFAFFNQKTK